MALPTYLIQVSIAWGIFIGFYWLLLRKETFFTANRFYLLSTLIFSLVLPYLEWSEYYASIPVETLEMLVPSFESDTTQVIWWQQPTFWLTGIYIIGVTYFTIQFISGFKAIFQLLQKGNKSTYKGYTIIISSQVAEPFSFLNYLFVNEELTKHPESQQQILEHELAHLKGRHSIDLLIAESLRILFWFVPFIHFYKQEIRTLHEYLADAAVLRSTSKQAYGNLLLQQTFNSYSFSFTNHFHSQLKKRIIMMTKQPSSTVAYWKYALILPMLVLMTLTFSSTNLLAQSKKSISYEEVDKMPSFKGCEAGDKACSHKNLINFIIENLKYPKEDKKAGVEGKVLVEFIVHKSGQVKDAKVVKAISPTCGEAALAVVNAMPNWTPGVKDGKKVSVKMVLPFSFALSDKE